MAKGKSIPAPEVTPKKYSQQEFVDMYLALCKQTEWQISGQPALRPMNDLGGSMVIVQLAVVPYTEPK